MYSFFTKHCKTLLLLAVLFFSIPVFAEAIVVPITGPDGTTVEIDLSQDAIADYGRAGAMTCSYSGATSDTITGCSVPNENFFNALQNGTLTDGTPTDLSTYEGPQSTSVFDAISNLSSFLQDILLWLVSLPVIIASMFLYVSGFLFDNSITFTILNFSSNYSSFFAQGIDTAWKSFRDIGNIVMIGIFVYIAFRVILGINGFKLKETAARLMIVAVLINFSLFFTKVIVDISNITATQFVRATGTTATDGTLQSNTPTIAQTFADRAGVKGVLSGGAKDVVKNLSGQGFTPSTDALLYILITTIFFFAVGSVLLYGAILLITRMVAIVLLMVLSSLAFVSYMTPKLEGYWSTWWQKLLQYAFFAPLYMLLLWAVLKITETMGSTGQSASAFERIAEGDLFSAIIKVAVIVGLLYGATKIADSLSIYGAKTAKKVSLRALGIGVSPLTASAAFVGRNSLGRAAASVRDAQARAAASDNRLVRSLSDLAGGAKLNKALDNVAKSQFQLRDVKALGGALGKSTTEKEQAGLIAAGFKSQAEQQAKLAQEQIANENKPRDDAPPAPEAKAPEKSDSAGATADIAKEAGKAAAQGAADVVKDARTNASASEVQKQNRETMKTIAEGMVPQGPSQQAQNKARAQGGAETDEKIKQVAGQVVDQLAQQAQAKQSGAAGKQERDAAKARVDDIVSRVLGPKDGRAVTENAKGTATQNDIATAAREIAAANANNALAPGSLKDAVLKEIGSSGDAMKDAFAGLESAMQSKIKEGGSGNATKTQQEIADAAKQTAQNTAAGAEAAQSTAKTNEALRRQGLS